MAAPAVNAGVVGNNPSNQACGRQQVQCHQHTSFARKVGEIAKFTFLAAGSASLVGLAVVNPAISKALGVAFSKVASTWDLLGCEVAGNLTACAGGTIAAGALNVLDGALSLVKASGSKANLEMADKELPKQVQRSQAFSNLKKLYSSTQRRGALQTALGIAAITVGSLALVGVLANPYVLLGVGVAATCVLLGAQLHKFVVSRQIKEAQREYAELRSSTPLASPAAADCTSAA